MGYGFGFAVRLDDMMEFKGLLKDNIGVRHVRIAKQALHIVKSPLKVDTSLLSCVA